MKQLASSEDYPDNRLPVLRQGQDPNWKAVDHRHSLRGYLSRAFMAYNTLIPGHWDATSQHARQITWLTQYEIRIWHGQNYSSKRSKNAANQPDRSTWRPTTIKLHLLPCFIKLYDLFWDSFMNKRAEPAEMINALHSVKCQGWHIEAYKNSCAIGKQEVLRLLAPYPLGRGQLLFFLLMRRLKVKHHPC